MSTLRPKTGQDVFSEAHALHLVDTSRAKDGVWLVKVPKYLAELWQNAGPDGVVGKVVIAGASSTGPSDGNKRPGSQVTLVTDRDLLAQAGENGNLIPQEHQFLIQSSATASASGGHSNNPNRPGQGNPIQKRAGVMQGQELIILCEDDIVANGQVPTTSSSSNSSTLPPIPQAVPQPPFSNAPLARYSRRLSLFGRVNSRAECRPPPNTRYMRLKAEQLKAKKRPKHEVCLLKEPIRNYKPVSNHLINIEYEARKKAEGKNLRREKEEVMQDLFKAFEKHQYYAIKDLIMLTKQPVSYLTEILKEIAILNTHVPHKNMWELKPEYRHYAPPENPSEPKQE